MLATTRGYAGRGAVECVHFGSIAIVDRDGKVIASVGDPGGINFSRSTLKPLQALPFVADGGLARFGFGSQELALLCSSHSGEAVHVSLVQSILDRVGARVSDLQCGSHPPRYFAATGTSCSPTASISALHHNCSGKHSGFLAYCRLHGHRLDDYLHPDSPLQVRVRNTVQGFCPGEQLVAGIDGCSAPNFALPLRRIAQAYCRIACEDDPELRALCFAMVRHPDLVSGTARTDLALMHTGAGDWVSKIGADGLQAIGVRSKGLGIAVRIAGGDTPALHATTVEVLHQIGLLDEPLRTPLAAHFRPALRNVRGIETGRFLPLFALPRLAGP
ncbi:L-asparagine amidohydrolase [Burkholderiales bacterium]|nr:L-asparagine amidohydrolase [Burkholderiales bacterium]